CAAMASKLAIIIFLLRAALSMVALPALAPPPAESVFICALPAAGFPASLQAIIQPAVTKSNKNAFFIIVCFRLINKREKDIVICTCATGHGYSYRHFGGNTQGKWCNVTSKLTFSENQLAALIANCQLLA